MLNILNSDGVYIFRYFICIKNTINEFILVYKQVFLFKICFPIRSDEYFQCGMSGWALGRGRSDDEHQRRSPFSLNDSKRLQLTQILYLRAPAIPLDS